MILPLRVLGRLARKSISFGATAAPSRLRAKPRSSFARRLVLLDARPQRDKGLNDLARHRVRLADDAGLGHGGMLHQRALDLERPDQMAGRFDDVVRASDEPEVAVGVPTREIAGQVIVADEALAITLLLAKIAAHHRRPASLERELSLRVGLIDHVEAAVAACAGRSALRRRVSAGPSNRA